MQMKSYIVLRRRLEFLRISVQLQEEKQDCGVLLSTMDQELLPTFQLVLHCCSYLPREFQCRCLAEGRGEFLPPGWNRGKKLKMSPGTESFQLEFCIIEYKKFFKKACQLSRFAAFAKCLSIHTSQFVQSLHGATRLSGHTKVFGL